MTFTHTPSRSCPSRDRAMSRRVRRRLQCGPPSRLPGAKSTVDCNASVAVTDAKSSREHAAAAILE